MTRTVRLTGSALTAAGTTVAVVSAVHTVVNVHLVRRPGAHRAVRPTVSILVPARDEAAHITACLRALDGQGPVIVLDDESTDATAQLARAAGAQVVPGSPRPAGWLGKPWACAQLVESADLHSEILVFIDADVVVAPDAIAATVDLLLDAGLDIVCPFPRQLADGPAERLLQPLLQWSWLALLPLRVAERSARPSLTAACGQLVAIRRSALDRAGGFAAVRGAVLDDVALVRAVKRAGGRGGVADGSGVASCRMYDGWQQVRDGYAKSLWSAFGTPAGAVGGIGVLALGWLVPPVAALHGSKIGAVGYAAGVVSRVAAARRTGGAAWPDALAHPVSVAGLCWLTARSVRGRRSGDLRWKGRPVVVSHDVPSHDVVDRPVVGQPVANAPAGVEPRGVPSS